MIRQSGKPFTNAVMCCTTTACGEGSSERQCEGVRDWQDNALHEFFQSFFLRCEWPTQLRKWTTQFREWPTQLREWPSH